MHPFLSIFQLEKSAKVQLPYLKTELDFLVWFVPLRCTSLSECMKLVSRWAMLWLFLLPHPASLLLDRFLIRADSASSHPQNSMMWKESFSLKEDEIPLYYLGTLASYSFRSCLSSILCLKAFTLTNYLQCFYASECPCCCHFLEKASHFCLSINLLQISPLPESFS